MFTSFMNIALDEARAASRRGEVPVGAVLLRNEVELARAGNRMRELCDPTAHAEMQVIRAACAAAGTDRLPRTTLYVTLEPCPMCAAAISAARITTVIYGASDPKSGGIENGPRIFTHPQAHHRPEVIGGIGEREAGALLRDFFHERRSR